MPFDPDLPEIIASAFGSWLVRGARTNEFARPSAIGALAGAAADLAIQWVDAEYPSATDKQLRDLAIATITTWAVDRIVVPDPKKRTTLPEAFIDGGFGTHIGKLIDEALRGL